MKSILNKILNQGTINSGKDFRIFWLMHDSIDVKSKYDPSYTPEFKPSISVELREGIAAIFVDEIADEELTLDDCCRYHAKAGTPILFYDYDGISYDSYELLQRAYMYKQLEDYRITFEDQVMSIKALDDLCKNKEEWDAGMNYTHFMDAGRILVEGFPVGDGYEAIYADIQPLSGYEVLSNEEDYTYFKDFKVRVNFLYPEKVW